MYLYFMPLPSSTGRPESVIGSTTSTTINAEAVIPKPTHDGGLEHTAARFLPASEWIELARKGSIILFPPQLFLLHLIAPYLDDNAVKSSNKSPASVSELQERRQRLRDFVKTGNPPWGQMCISPVQLFRRNSDRRAVLWLEKPGYELEGSHRKGDSERVVLVNFKKEGPRDVEVRWRKAVFDEERRSETKL